MSGEPDRSTSARAPRAIPATNIARIDPRDQSRRIVSRRSRGPPAYPGRPSTASLARSVKGHLCRATEGQPGA
jgi:hypothetical protein